MLLNKFLYKVLPVSLFSQVRLKYYAYRKKLHKPLSEQELRLFLKNNLGVDKGKVVFVHSSFDFLNVDVTPYKLLTILLDLVGEEGTLIFPAWHFAYRAEDYLQKDLIFDVKRSPSVMGLLTELARRHPKAVRSLHPTTSIVAIGKYAHELTADHHKSIYPCGEQSPYFKMIKYNAIIVGIGVQTHFLSFVHCPEDVLKNKFPLQTRTSKTFKSKVKLLDNSVIEVETLAAHSNISKRDIPKFFKQYISTQIGRDIVYKGNSFFKVDATKLYDCIIELANDAKTIYNI